MDKTGSLKYLRRGLGMDDEHGLLAQDIHRSRLAADEGKPTPCQGEAARSPGAKELPVADFVEPTASEPPRPTVDELAEALGRKAMSDGVFLLWPQSSTSSALVDLIRAVVREELAGSPKGEG